MIVGTGTQILADGQDIAVHRAQVGHGVQQFAPRLTHARNDAALGEGGIPPLLRPPQQIQRPLVAAAVTDDREHAGHTLDVMPEDLRSSVQHRLQRSGISLEIWNEHLHRALRQVLVNLRDDGGKDPGAAVGEVVAVHRRDHRVTESHGLHRARHPFRFRQVEFRRQPVRNRTVRAVARAQIPQGQEGGRAPAPALPQIRAARFLTHGVQTLCAHDLHEVGVVRSGRQLRFQPLRPL